MLKYELNRAFNKAFFIAIMIGVASGIGGIFSYYLDAQYFPPEAVSCYEAWIYCLGLAEGSFYKVVFPILICIPYLGTLYSERNSSFIYFVTIRTPYKKYLLIKLGIGTVSAMAAIVSVLSIWFVVCAIMFPFNLPITNINYVPLGAFSGYYRSSPGLYIIIITLLNMMTAGLFFLASATISLFVRSKRLIIVLPFIIYLILVILSGYYPFNLIDPIALFLPFENTDITSVSIITGFVAIFVLSGFGTILAIRRDSREIL